MSKAKTFMLDQTGANTEEILKWDGSQWNPSNTLNLGGDLTVTGDLAVNGTTTTLNTETVLVEDNIITVNNGETGAGVTAGSAGIDVDRGTETNYEFKFVEATDDFRIGQVGSLQAVATREDTPTDNGVAFWDNATNKFETSTALTYTDTTMTLAAGINNGYRLDNGTVQGVMYNTGGTSMTVGTVSSHPLVFFTNNATAGSFATNGDFTAVGNISSGGNFANIGTGKSTETVEMSIAPSRSGDGTSLIDFIGDTTYTDFGLRIIRNAGANNVSAIEHRGTGTLSLTAVDAGNVNINTNGSTRLLVDSSGNVGVGTNTPAYSMDIRNTATNALAIFRDLDVTSVGAAGTVFELGALNGTTATAGSSITGVLNNPATTGYMAFNTLTGGTLTEKVRIQSSGNVGIGETAPTAKLHVGGTAGVDGIRFPDGTLQTTASTGAGSTSKGFKAYLGTNQNVPANTITVLDLDTEVYDTEGWFNTTTNRFQPDEAGTYMVISACVSVDVNSNSEFIQCLPRLNGTTTLVTTTNYGGTSGFTSAIAMTTVEMNGTTDFLELTCRHNITGDISSGVSNTFMAVHKLG